MTLTFYVNSSDPRALTKTLTSLGDIADCTMRDALNVRNPVFRVVSGALPTGFNYCYCDWTQRYYFVRDISAYRNGVYDITCACDVLQTFAQYIKAQTATVARNETLVDGYLPDVQYQVRAYQEIVTKKFPTAITGDSLILMTVG